MRLLTAAKRDVKRAVRLAIGGILAVAGQQARILGALDWRADMARPQQVRSLDEAVLTHMPPLPCVSLAIARHHDRRRWSRLTFRPAGFRQRILEAPPHSRCYEARCRRQFARKLTASDTRRNDPSRSRVTLCPQRSRCVTGRRIRTSLPSPNTSRSPSTASVFWP